MNWLVAALTLCALVSCAHSDRDGSTIAWCYDKPSCNDATWPTIAPKFCNGSRQSPIDIKTASAQADAALTAFTFTNFNSTSALTKMENTGKTVKVTFVSGVSVMGGGLSSEYNSLQFHLHWGNGSSVPGSEHTVNGKRYPMELHIVNLKKSLNITQGLADPEGLAALGFFIEVMAGSDTGKPASWKKLTDNLSKITNSGTSTLLASGISLDDLLTGVDRTKYYRYLGSLTTPNCNEAVVWTVFKDPIKVSKDLIDLFSTTVRVGNSTSALAVKTYRNVQKDLPVSTQPASSNSPSSTCYSLGLMALSLVLGRS